jgi:chromosome segregation ATPase
MGMSEPIVLYGIGFLLAASLAYNLLTMARRTPTRPPARAVEPAQPSMMADIEADMDQLHAQIAMATRRLEIGVAQMKRRTSSQIGEIGKSSETLARIRAELTNKTAAVAALQDRERVLIRELHTTEAELGARTRSLDEIEQTLSNRKAELARIRDDFDLHPALARAEARHAAEVQTLKADKARVDEQLAESQAECARLQGYLDSMKQQVETTWASERMANAVLRERINDVASEVVRVAIALEGLNSPMETIANGKSARPQASAPAIDLEDMTLPPPGFSEGGEDSKAALVHRIRALRERAAQAAAS